MWEFHFWRIKNVCPWSWDAWQRGKIDVVDFEKVLPLGDYEARVYTFLSYTEIETLDMLVEIFDEDYPECEFLWSHPDHTRGGNNQTPVPVIIQQDRKTLKRLRKGIKHGSNKEAKETS